MKLKKLQLKLENVKTIKNPKIELEQYCTMPHIAACVLYTAQFTYGDITDKSVAVLCCGSGMLCVGAALLNAKYCAGLDKDSSAISLSVENVSKHNLLKCCDFILCDTNDIKFVQPKVFDTVIMNMTFGTEDEEIDFIFLEKALKMASKSVYSIYKKSSRKTIIRKAREYGVYAKVIAELKLNLPDYYKFHKQDLYDTEIDIILFILTPKPALHKSVS